MGWIKAEDEEQASENAHVLVSRDCMRILSSKNA